MSRYLRYLFALFFIFLVACSPEPKEVSAEPSSFSFYVDPVSQTVKLGEGGLVRSALQQTGEVRVLTSQELTLFDYSPKFSPGNLLKIYVRFKNSTQTLEFMQPLTFSVAPGSTNIVRSTEPTVTTADLGGDDTLSPGEITGTELTVNDPDTYLVFEVEHKNEPFTYFVDASAYVREIRPMWPVQLGTDAFDSGNSVTTDSDGNIYLSGFTGGSFPGNTNAGGWDFFIAKYAPDSSQLWLRQFGSAADERVTGVTTDRDGNIYLSGNTEGNLPGNTSVGNDDAYLAKYASDGHLLWIKQFGSTANDSARDVATDSAGNVYVSGETRGSLPGNTSAGGIDAFIAKYASDGRLLWIKQFGSSSVSRATTVATDPYDHVYLGGGTSGLVGNTSAGGADSFVAKYAPDGSQLWLRQFGTTDTDGVDGIATDQDGNVYLSGENRGSFAGNSSAGGIDAFVAKYAPDGSQLWIRQFGSAASDGARDVATDSAGNVYLSGTTDGSLPGNTSVGSSDAFVVKYAPDGSQLWLRQFGSSTSDSAAGVATDQDSNVYVSGGTSGLLGNTSAGGLDAFVAKYDSSGFPK